MNVSLEDIRNFMSQNNIDNNFNINKPIKELGIYQIKEEKGIDDKYLSKRLIIKIKGPDISLYKNGVYTIKIDFPKDYPKSRPRIFCVNKIFHMQVNLNTGYLCIFFFSDWRPDTSIKEVLVGIYLYFIYYQFPQSLFSNELYRMYDKEHLKFEEMIREYVKKYASPNKDDLKLINEMNNYKDNENNKKNISNNHDEIYNLKNKIKELESELIKIKDENNRLKILEKNYNDMKKENEKEIMKLNEKNKELLEKIKPSSNNTNNNNEKNDNNNYIKIIELMEEIQKKNNELEELKTKLPFNLNKDEKLMTVIFISDAQDIHYSLICKNTDKFNVIENRLYEAFPQYLESENYFIANGKKINKSKSLEENNIKFSDVIILNKYE